MPPKVPAMSLQDDFDDQCSDGRRRRSYRPLILLLVIAIGLFLVGAAGTVAVFAMRSQAVTAARDEELRAAKQAAAAARPLHSLDEFEKAVRGQHAEVVLATVGRPDKETAWADAKEGPSLRWVYRERVVNPATGNPYTSATILFDQDGIVTRVEYTE